MGVLDSVISGLFGLGQQAWSNAYNKKEADKNREFQSEEAETNRIFQSNEAALQRDWSAAEAERARDWQEEMNAKYNSISGKIQQAEEAGVNPLFAVTGNAVSPASASSSAPSGASAGGVGTPSGDSATMSLVNIIGAMLDAKKVASEAKLNEAEANKIEQETPLSVQKLISEISSIDMDAQVSGAMFNQIIEQTKNIIQERSNLVAELNLTYDQAENVQAATQKVIAEYERIDRLSDSEARSAEARAAIDEFEASIAKVVDDFSNGDKAKLDELVSGIVKIALKKFGLS